MLSLGTEFFLAFWIASYRVGFPPGSPPPRRAATSIFLIRLANSLPRLASIAAFLCLVVAHLECPLIYAPSACSDCAAGTWFGCAAPILSRLGWLTYQTIVSTS